MSDLQSHDFKEGALIAPGRSILKGLGGGSRYEVCLVWDDRLYALVVAKILRPDQVEDQRALSELRREAEVLERLAHPGLVRGFGGVFGGPYPHLLLEHLEGPNLRRLFKRYGPLPLEQLLPLACHVASVLHYMAAEGYVHLDVKPANIVMGVPARLLDLSIARTLEQAARLRSGIGTDGYMPPEQCDPTGGHGTVGPPADVFGLGATLYHAVTGQAPFPRGERESEDLNLRFPQLLMEPTPPPKHLPAALCEVLMATMARKPEDRPVAAEIATALGPLVEKIPRKLTVSRRGIRALGVPHV
jgi:eukaryotic-like serine/threonine-protein kinase